MYKFFTKFVFILFAVCGYSNSIHAQYCTTFTSPIQPMSFDCIDGDGVTSFVLNGASSTSINYYSSACNAASYWNFTNLSVSMMQGSSYSGTAFTDALWGDNYMSIWIDFDDNNIFSANEKVVSELAISNVSSTAFSINVENSALIGTHRMRVMAGYLPATNIVLQPCNLDASNYMILVYGRVQDFTVNILPNTPTPVTMGILEGENSNGNASLKWVTYAEKNNKGFEVQQSTDGKNFKRVNFVNSKSVNGSSNQTLEYAIEMPLLVQSQFKLVQVDFDGTQTESNIVQLIPNLFSNQVQLFPNPAGNIVKIKNVSVRDGEKVEVLIFDLLGKQVFETQFLGKEKELSLTSLSPGTYVVKVINGNSMNTIKLVKE